MVGVLGTYWAGLLRKETKKGLGYGKYLSPCLGFLGGAPASPHLHCLIGFINFGFRGMRC